MSQKRRKSRGVVDTSVLVAGVAGMKSSVHESNVASAKFVQRWVQDRRFVWLITEDVLDEYREVLARLGVRRPLIGKIVNTLRAKSERGRQKNGRLKMVEQIVRCPYCVLGDQFRPMLSRPGGWFICHKCGHTAISEKPEFKCFCQKCGGLNPAA